jgi:aspartate aminotransferase
MPQPTFNRHVAAIKPSVTMAVTGKAKEMKAKGIDVVSMSAGEPDFDTPDHIKEAAIQAIRDGFTKYTPVAGMPELRAAVAAKFKRENGTEYDSAQVLTSIGGKHSCYLAVAALIDEGDEVIIPAPYWVSYPDMVILAGGTPVILATSNESGLKITADQLKAAITPKTKMIILNSPSNPSGAVYSRDELRALGDVLVGTDVFIVSDDIYEHLVYEGEFANILNAKPELYDQTILVNGVAKAYAMTGWRVGYAAGPLPIIKEMSKIQSQQTSNVTSIAQKASIAALEGPQDHLAVWKAEYDKRRSHIVERLNAIDGVNCAMPKGAFYAYPDVSPYVGKSYKGTTITGDIELTDLLLEEFKVATVPGTGFGTPGYIRLSYATSMEQIDKALDRVADGLASLS